MEFFKINKVYDFVKYSYYGLGLSAVLLVLSVVLFATKGFNFGIDFAGGSIVQIQYPEVENAPVGDIREILEDKFKGVQVSEFGAANEVLIRIPAGAAESGESTSSLRATSGASGVAIHNENTAAAESITANAAESAQSEPKQADAELSERITSLLKNTGKFEIRRMDSVGPKVGDELARAGALSLALALIAMMAYVSFRYEWRFSLAGIVALIHDVMLAAAVVIVFNVDFSLEVVAALLTLIGYSINDTIIIFDRIREQMLSRRERDIKFVINEAISRTLSRSLLTSLTLFFVVLTLYLFGGEIIVGFSLPMLAGTIIGTYSSIFVAPALAVLFGFNLDSYYAKENAKLKRKEDKKRLRAMYEQGQV